MQPEVTGAAAAAARTALPPLQFVQNPDLAAVPQPPAALLALYFSAHWCGPCRAFTPQLKEFYEKTSREDLEIVFVSLDRDLEQFRQYFATMPWLAMDFEGEREDMAEALRVQGIPALVVFHPSTGKIVSAQARQEVGQNMHDPMALVAAWKARAAQRDAAPPGY